MSYHPPEPSLHRGDAMECYDDWPTPTVIVSDGPYGLGNYPGDIPNPAGLAEWYRPHVEAWARRSTSDTTLWFWGTEIGWALTHPVLSTAGWMYRGCHVWNKGISHIAGRTNTATLRRFPVVTEVCAHYVRHVEVVRDDERMTLQKWLRSEWLRSGLSVNSANRACGVKNAAARKYLTLDDKWYCPPPPSFRMLSDYANEHGDQGGVPYFSFDGDRPLSEEQWDDLREGRLDVRTDIDMTNLRRAKFYCEHGITNVWDVPPVGRQERLKVGSKSVHINQKPLILMDRIIRASSDIGDVVWEPFGGLCSASVAAHRLKRESYSAEIDEKFYRHAKERLEREVMNPVLFS